MQIIPSFYLFNFTLEVCRKNPEGLFCIVCFSLFILAIILNINVHMPLTHINRQAGALLQYFDFTEMGWSLKEIKSQDSLEKMKMLVEKHEQL